MDVRRALSDDLKSVASLLEAVGLPALPERLPLQNCLVALDGGHVVGAAALEVRGLRGHLCSLAVDSGRRRQGLGHSLLESILARAHELSLRELYVLPRDERAFFEKEGFLAVESDDVAREIRALPVFREAGEDGGVLRFPLASRCV